MRPGQIIAGKYRLLRVVRSGGVAVVYRGERSAEFPVINGDWDWVVRFRPHVPIDPVVNHGGLENLDTPNYDRFRTWYAEGTQ